MSLLAAPQLIEHCIRRPPAVANAGEAFGKGRSLEFGLLVKCKRISMGALMSCKLVSMRVLSPLSMLASCVFFASNVGCSRTFVGPCGPKFFVFGLLVSRKLVSMTGVLPRRSEVSILGRLCTEVSSSILLRFRFFESCRLKVFPAVRTGAFRADFVASQKVRFRWLPTGF